MNTKTLYWRPILAIPLFLVSGWSFSHSETVCHVSLCPEMTEYILAFILTIIFIVISKLSKSNFIFYTITIITFIFLIFLPTFAQNYYSQQDINTLKKSLSEAATFTDCRTVEQYKEKGFNTSQQEKWNYQRSCVEKLLKSVDDYYDCVHELICGGQGTRIPFRRCGGGIIKTSPRGVKYVNGVCDEVYNSDLLNGEPEKTANQIQTAPAADKAQIIDAFRNSIDENSKPNNEVLKTVVDALLDATPVPSGGYVYNRADMALSYYAFKVLGMDANHPDIGKYTLFGKSGSDGTVNQKQREEVHNNWATLLNL